MWLLIWITSPFDCVKDFWQCIQMNDFLFLAIFALDWGPFDFPFCLKMKFKLLLANHKFSWINYWNTIKSIIIIFHNDRERIKPGKQDIRNILRFIKNLKDIRCFLFCEATKLRLNFVHCFIQKISLSVPIGDLPSANVITELRWILKMHKVSCLY